MAVQSDGFVIREGDLFEAIAKTEALTAIDEAVDEDLDEEDGDVEDGDDLMDDDEEIVFGPDDDIPPFESNVEEFWTKRHGI